MISISRALKSRLVRFLMATFVCTFLFLSSAFPVVAATSSPTKGEDALKEVQKESEEVLRSNPRSMEEVQSKAKGGLNAVQGGADMNKMYRPENAQDATSVEERVQDFLNDLTDSDEK
ncbi:MAG: low temperature-induced protein [Microcoleaceae cyanobacterium]